MATIFRGDSYPITMSLKEDSGATYPIASGATVTAGLVTASSGTLLCGPWSVVIGTAGSNWANGVVVVNVVGADTTPLLPQKVKIEVKVAAGAVVRTWRSDVISLEKRGLP